MFLVSLKVFIGKVTNDTITKDTVKTGIRKSVVGYYTVYKVYTNLAEDE